MRRWVGLTLGLLVVGTAGCQDAADTPAETLTEESVDDTAAWTTLFDGTSLNGWTMIGNANWELVDGAVQADSGTGFLVSAQAYDNFELRVEFWVDEPANSGVFIRCSNREAVDANNAYEVNIFDTRPEQNYRTGGIVTVAEVLNNVNTAGQWNTFEIMADGSHLMATLNGTLTADANDTTHAGGPIALQYGAGVVKFRRVEIRPL